jgi:hypothetical protein
MEAKDEWSCMRCMDFECTRHVIVSQNAAIRLFGGEMNGYKLSEKIQAGML